MSTNTPMRTARLRVDDKGDGGVPRVLLNDVDLAYLLARDGLSVAYGDDDNPDAPAMPTVTMKFGPGALELDIDVDLARRIVDGAGQ